MSEKGKNPVMLARLLEQGELAWKMQPIGRVETSDPTCEIESRVGGIA